MWLGFSGVVAVVQTTAAVPIQPLPQEFPQAACAALKKRKKKREREKEISKDVPHHIPSGKCKLKQDIAK